MRAGVDSGWWWHGSTDCALWCGFRRVLCGGVSHVCFVVWFQTYVNESRIPEQEYVTLNHMDSIRLGYDILSLHALVRVVSDWLTGTNTLTDKRNRQDSTLKKEKRSRHAIL